MQNKWKIFFFQFNTKIKKIVINKMLLEFNFEYVC